MSCPSTRYNVEISPFAPGLVTTLQFANHILLSEYIISVATAAIEVKPDDCASKVFFVRYLAPTK